MRVAKRFNPMLPLVMLFGAAPAFAADVPTPPTDPVLASFVKLDQFTEMKISPTGQYIAASVPLEGKAVLAVLDRTSMKLVGHMALDGNNNVNQFWWVNDNRLIVSIAEKEGALDSPLATGELVGMNADGSRSEMLIGYRASKPSGSGATNIVTKRLNTVAAFLEDPLAEDDNNVLISYYWFDSTSQARFRNLALMDVNNGRVRDIGHSPVRQASFVIDHAHVARFAAGEGEDNAEKLYYRPGADAEWKLINDENASGVKVWPVGFNANDSIAYLQAEEKAGPDGIYTFDPKTSEQKLLLKDARQDPRTDGYDSFHYLMESDGRTPFAVEYDGAPPRIEYLDAEAPEAKLTALLRRTFAGQRVELTSYTKDNKLALVLVEGARKPGDFYLFDTVAGKAAYLASRGDAVDDDKLGEVRPVQLKARDGVPIDGLLTLPFGSNGKSLPLVVNPHGGPVGVSDQWRYNYEAQLLAAKGYAVLQVNYRGSGGYGRSFRELSYGQWGLAMQDDLTDATRWAISQGVADPQRICIYGGSYGGYAALMGVAKEPTLYKCAVGYVGMYDLSTWRRASDTADSRSSSTSLNVFMGTDAAKWASASPARLAASIKVPVFLAAGGEDKRTTVGESERMRDALSAAGNPPEWLEFKTEGHGFYTQAHRMEFYGKLVDFLDRNIGSKASH